MSLKKSLQTLACLILYRIIEPGLINQDFNFSNRRPGHIPFIDSCLGQNTLQVNFNGGIGRMRGQAFGCGNPFENKSGLITAVFRKTFALSPDDIISNETYEFRIEVSAQGRMRHFPASSTSGSPFFAPKQPPPDTLGLIFTTIRVFQGGNTIGFSPQFFHYNKHVFAGGFQVNDVIANSGIVSVDFTPTSANVIVFEVATSVQARAMGDFSDIRIGGISPINTSFLEVNMNPPQVQKRPGNDVCAELLGLGS